MKVIKLLALFSVSLLLTMVDAAAQPANPIVDQILTLNGTKESTVNIVNRYIKYQSQVIQVLAKQFRLRSKISFAIKV